jgi:hypothetical protein
VARKPLTLGTVVLQEGDWLSAHCLEHDIATRARTLEDLSHEPERLIVGHAATGHELGKTPVEGLPPAPPKDWKMFDPSRVPFPQPRLTFTPRRRV